MSWRSTSVRCRQAMSTRSWPRSSRTAMPASLRAAATSTEAPTACARSTRCCSRTRAASGWSTARSSTTSAPARWSTTSCDGARRSCPRRRASLSTFGVRAASLLRPASTTTSTCRSVQVCSQPARAGDNADLFSRSDHAVGERCCSLAADPAQHADRWLCGPPTIGAIMGLSWQQGPLGRNPSGTFLTATPMPERALYVEPLRRRMSVELGGGTIARSDEAVILFEPARYPVAYFPIGDIDQNVLQPSDHESTHADLGRTTWFNVVGGDGETLRRGAWQH